MVGSIPTIRSVLPDITTPGESISAPCGCSTTIRSPRAKDSGRYLAQRIVGFGRISDFFLGGVASKCPEALAAVVNSAGYVAVCWLFLYFLYRKNVFLKV